jgi:hypothetical protein
LKFVVTFDIFMQTKELQEPEAVDGLAGGGFGKKVRPWLLLSSNMACCMVHAACCMLHVLGKKALARR